MKGYPVPEGYMGYINGKYRLFSDQGDYVAIYRENEREKN